MSKWSEFYQQRLNDTYRSHLQERYRPFLNEIIKASLRLVNNTSLTFGEFGCGAGNISILLSKMMPFSTHHLLDNDPDMLSLCQKNINNLIEGTSSQRNFTLRQHDILVSSNLPEFDIIFSHGVLEHFNDRDINEIIRIQKQLSNNIIHYVPGLLHGTPSFGDERLMTVEDWQRICHPDEVMTFNYGYDYVLMWR
jgi:SAM-dependent methyltransferase